MEFRGLFVGIDRYASRRINWLSCAAKDAVALHALFADNFGAKSTTRLIDAEATRESITGALSALVHCDADDVVVIAFSGHGSQTHELVPFDADPDDLAKTALPLQELTDRFSRIPANRVLCILDCCFSGGAGAKVLRTEAVARDLLSEDELLRRLSGNGRLILTASTADQPAWEIARHGHGLLTHHLLAALQGAEEVRESGTISAYRLLEYVTHRVTADAGLIGKKQHPTLRGTIDGDLRWPVLTRGALYATAFPERGRPAATAETRGLTRFGYPPKVVESWAERIPALNALQLDAINGYGLLSGEHLVISAPTSSGKTMVGEMAALLGVTQRKRAVFLFPLRALVNDKFRHFSDAYGPFGARIIRATGEIADDIPAMLRGQYDIALLTYEKFASIVAGRPHVLEQVGTVVIDEAQMIADETRGTTVEFLLTLIRMQRRRGIEPQVIALSAVIGSTNGMDRWLGARLLRHTDRPVPLREGLLCGDGTFRHLTPEGIEGPLEQVIVPTYIKGTSQDWIIPLVRRLVGEGKQVIVFRETKGQARGCAKYLAAALGLPAADEVASALTSADPSAATLDLRKCLEGGVAFHVADLDPEERRSVEEGFRARDSKIRVISATTTLAMGINTPADAVVIAGLQHPPSPHDPEPKPYSVAEYKNMVGRAGRLGFAAEGASYLLATSTFEEERLWRDYVLAAPEDVASRFGVNDDVRTLVVRVLAASSRSHDARLTTKDVVDFLEGSFGAFRHLEHAGRARWTHGEIQGAVDELFTHGLVGARDDHLRLTPLGRFAGEAGVEVESILRLVRGFRGLSPADVTDPTLLAAAQITVELDGVYMPLNRKSKQKEPDAWRSVLRQQRVHERIVRALDADVRDGHDGTLRAKRTAACLFWIGRTPLAEIERQLTQYGGGTDGAAGPVRSTASRTRDLLPAVAMVVRTVVPGCDLDVRCDNLLVRLETGAPAGAVEVARYAGSALSRGDYLQLNAAHLGTMDRLKQAEDGTVLNCVGGSQPKLAAIRAAIERWHADVRSPSPGINLPDYEAE